MNYESRGQEFESLRARHSATAKASSRILAATPRRGGSQPKISKTTPCKVAGGRRQGRFGPTLDTSGKSAALLHHRTIRKTPAGPQRRAVRCDVGRKSPPTIEVALALEVAMAGGSGLPCDHAAHPAEHAQQDATSVDVLSLKSIVPRGEDALT